MTDAFLFSKSTLPQGVDTETPFVSKNWNYINDINGGVYQNSSGLSLVQFDLSSIYNSTQLIDPSSMFMAVPITYVSAYASATAGSGSTPSLVAPVAGSFASTALKSGYFQLLHGCDLQVNGKTLEQFIPNLNSYVSFKLASQMSQDDLKTLGPTLGMGEFVDNWESMIFNGSATARATGTFPSAVAIQGNGNGLTNNLPYPISSVQYSVVCSTVVTTGATTLAQAILANSAIKVGQLVQGNGIAPNTFVANISGTTLTLTGATSASTNGITATGTVSNQYLTFLTPTGGDQGDQAISGVQWSGAYNNGLFSRIKRITDVSVATPVAGSSNLYGGSSGNQTNCISNSTKVANEFKPYYTILNSNYMVWYDVAIIRMQDILDSMRAMPMMKKWDGIFRAYLNVGQVVSNISDSGAFSNTITTPCLVSSGSGNTFTNTCPLIHTALVNTPRLATSIASGLFIGSPTDTAISASGNTVNLKSAGASHFLTSCRMYYTQIQLKPEKLDYYISNNRSKKICWTSILNNNFNNIGAGNTFSTLVQSGVSSPRGVLILPFLSTSTGSAITNNGATTTDGTTVASSITTFAQQLSPYDTAPATTSCASLINLQVAVGGVNVLSNIISYGYEEFLQQVSIYEKINGADFGLSCGLVSQAMWEHGYRAYYVDLSRANIADSMTPRNINLSFTNNSLQALDIQVFVEYYREGVVDVETGIVSC
jgi:hypothetical protein